MLDFLDRHIRTALKNGFSGSRESYQLRPCGGREVIIDRSDTFAKSTGRYVTRESSDDRMTRKPAEVAFMLGVGRGRVYDLIRTGELRSIRVGRTILIPLTAVEEFLNSVGGSR